MTCVSAWHAANGKLPRRRNCGSAFSYEELKASPDTAALRSRRDADRFDAFCDHLIVVRRSAGNEAGKFGVDDGEMVGTYRLLRQSVAEQNGGFYTQSEFDIAPLLAAKPALKFLELGRSCVLKQYRTKPVVELLWQGIWNYVRHHGMDVMLGCASLEGIRSQGSRAHIGFPCQDLRGSAGMARARSACSPG